MKLAGEDDPADEVLLAPDDDVVGVDIVGRAAADQCEEVGEASVVIKPANDDEVIVNGVTLTCKSSVATLRAACSAYGISR